MAVDSRLGSSISKSFIKYSSMLTTLG